MAAELDGCTVVVAEVPDDSYVLDPTVLADAKGSRYLELRCDREGSLERATTHARRPGTGAAPCLGPGEVCLVTGGVRGITACCATALAERTGCVPVFLGRSPADDPEVVAALDGHDYECCDVADAAALREVVARHGPIRGLIHGAGVNVPRRLRDITPESFAVTLRPKVTGLRTILDAVGADLRLVLGFGSIIGRQGLAGQAEYCVANDWMRVELERWAEAHPSCRTHLLEWSVWSGIGMGVRMDVLDGLRRQGVEPITPQRGVAALLDVLDDPDAPVTLLVTSRFPATPTLSVDGAGELWLRFAERPRVYTPGVEAVVEADLTLGADPYLDEHRIDGMPVLPAVVGLEAMVQSAAFAGAGGLTSLAGIEFRAPVTVDGPDGRTIQTAALVGPDGVDVVLRDDADRFVARAEIDTDEPEPAERGEPPRESALSPWYGSLLFHSGRFRRLVGYDRLSAFHVAAWLAPGEPSAWFSEFHSAELLLGDPGAHDATLHALMACVPHRRALPVGADRFTVWREPSGPLRVLGREVAHTVDDYEFDVDLVRPDGIVVARWRGLRLRAVGPVSWPDGMPSRLVGPWLSRRLIECGIADRVELASTQDTLLTGPDVSWTTVPAGSSRLARLHGVDAEIAELLASKIGEDIALAEARVRTARAVLGEQDTTFRVDQVTKDGIAVAHAGPRRVVTATVRTTDRVTVVAVTLGREC